MTSGYVAKPGLAKRLSDWLRFESYLLRCVPIPLTVLSAEKALEMIRVQDI